MHVAKLSRMVYLDLDGGHMRMCVFLGICQYLVLSIFLIFAHLLVISLSLMALNSTLCWWFYLQFRDGRDHGNVLRRYSWLFDIPLRFLLLILAQMVKNLQMWETWVQSLSWEDPLEKRMATHSSILAWKIPWAEEPGGLQSIGSQSWTQVSN